MCMCSSWYCPGMAEYLGILEYSDNGCSVHVFIPALSQSISGSQYTQTRGLHMCSSWYYPGMVRVSWELNVFYLKNFLCHSRVSLDIPLSNCLVNTFLISVAEWSSPSTTGPRPHPCSNFSFTAISHHKAVLFGGVQPEHEAVDDVYIIDFQSMVR